jgi:CRP-like cAMP-binding protein
MDSFNDVRQAIERFAPIPEPEWAWIRSHLGIRTIKSGQFLIRGGDTVDRLYFVRKGLFRVFYLKENEEVNRSFVTSNRLYTNSLAMQTGHPSHYWVEALQNGELAFVGRATIVEGYGRDPCWERIGRLSAERRLCLKEQQEQRFRSMTPEEHYFWMVENEPELCQGVPLYHLASYLRIRPETLSRIRSRAAAG